MAKDPICGMDVREENALHLLHCEHETLYFCSNKCKEIYNLKTGKKKPLKKKGRIAKFLDKLAKDNEQSFGGTPPKCH
ncbi:MAG: YHS domain-containing protein [Candidatus Zixiibacteriota bacterium]|nr:MAG: YHS domain-containing protein [candidate division Zixibacteria bacterium]